MGIFRGPNLGKLSDPRVRAALYYARKRRLDRLLSSNGDAGDTDLFSQMLVDLKSQSSQLIVHPLRYGSMFQDLNGSIPVTASGQQLGFALDWGFTGEKPVEGPQLALNGGFDTDTVWTKGGGWAITGGKAVATNSSQSIFQTPGVSAGKYYKVSVDTVISSGGLRVRLGFNGGVDLVNGTNELIIEATDNFLAFLCVGTTNAEIDNVLVNEFPGYHVIAASEAARGIFRDEGGFKWIEYNGLNTGYLTKAIPAPNVDKVQAFGAVTKLSDANPGILLESSLNSQSIAGSIQLLLNTDRSVTGRAKGSIDTPVQSPPLAAAPNSFVVSLLGDISGDSSILRIDGTQVAQNLADHGTGNYNPTGTHRISYGGRSGTTVLLNGRHMDTVGPMVRFSAANASNAQIESAEAYYTSKVAP